MILATVQNTYTLAITNRADNNSIKIKSLQGVILLKISAITLLVGWKGSIVSKSRDGWER
jgi:hypothetical protein